MNYQPGYSPYKLVDVLNITLLFILCFLLLGCNESHHYAPVTDIHSSEAIPALGKHRVEKGETLYEIAWGYGLDYRYLAKLNQISPPYAIQIGQWINLRPITFKVTTKIKQEQRPKSINVVQLKKKHPDVRIIQRWIRPAEGKMIDAYSRVSKGINIAGKEGQPIYASAAGQVVYCGNGLRSYGNLIIIKHNNVYLSAYAHNRHILVKEGEWVHEGQKIAEMGDTGTNKTMLHFEIRRAGKPIDPMKLISPLT